MAPVWCTLETPLTPPRGLGSIAHSLHLLLLSSTRGCPGLARTRPKTSRGCAGPTSPTPIRALSLELGLADPISSSHRRGLWTPPTPPTTATPPDCKAILKCIVTSATYRHSSLTSETLRQLRDPDIACGTRTPAAGFPPRWSETRRWRQRPARELAGRPSGNRTIRRLLRDLAEVK